MDGMGRRVAGDREGDKTMARLKFKGEIYKGADGKEEVVAREGDKIEVSDEKAKQLMQDFPKHWGPADKAAASIWKSLKSPNNKMQKPADNK